MSLKLSRWESVRRMYRCVTCGKWSFSFHIRLEMFCKWEKKLHFMVFAFSDTTIVPYTYNGTNTYVCLLPCLDMYGCVCGFHTWICVCLFYSFSLLNRYASLKGASNVVCRSIWGIWNTVGFFALASCCSFSTVYLVIVSVSRGKVKCKWI